MYFPLLGEPGWREVQRRVLERELAHLRAVSFVIYYVFIVDYLLCCLCVMCIVVFSCYTLIISGETERYE